MEKNPTLVENLFGIFVFALILIIPSMIVAFFLQWMTIIFLTIIVAPFLDIFDPWPYLRFMGTDTFFSLLTVTILLVLAHLIDKTIPKNGGYFIFPWNRKRLEIKKSASPHW